MRRWVTVAVVGGALLVGLLGPAAGAQEAGEWSGSVGASADDGWWYTLGGNQFYTDSTAVPFGSYGQTAGTGRDFFRFTAVTVPAGATITAASFTYQLVETYGTGECNVTIRGNDSGDAVAPVSYETGAALVLTAAGVEWDIAVGEVGTVYEGPSVVTVIQEIIDNPEWVEGNDLMLVVVDTEETAYRRERAASWDHDTYAAMALSIEWTEGGTEPGATIDVSELVNVTSLGLALLVFMVAVHVVGGWGKD